jgi:hypothetical protein
MTRMKCRGLRIPSAGLALAVLFAASCGGTSDPAGGISSQPMSGKIGGQPWTFKNGQTLGTAIEAYRVYASGTSFTPCAGEFPFEMDQVILTVPEKVGSYDLTLLFNQSLASAATGATYIATRGKLVVESITATTIKGAAKLEGNADNYLDGTFEATICQ